MTDLAPTPTTAAAPAASTPLPAPVDRAEQRRLVITVAVDTYGTRRQAFDVVDRVMRDLQIRYDADLLVAELEPPAAGAA